MADIIGLTNDYLHTREETFVQFDYESNPPYTAPVPVSIIQGEATVWLSAQQEYELRQLLNQRKDQK